MESFDFSYLRRVCIYLRKSRRDLELEQSGGEDTLARHRSILLEDARRWGLTIGKIYEEVVTGDTILERPRMTELLREIGAGRWDAVLCMDIDRLGRGGMRDQGVILDTFKWSSTILLTHERVFDLRNELDEEAMEYKAQGARFEYRMIKRRLARGREASVREGKFIGRSPPYGYRRVKLKGERGWTLEIREDQARVVRDIYAWYTGAQGERVGIARIVRRLNDMGISSPGGKDWTNCAVRSVLSNPEYCGFIRHGQRKTVRTFVDGTLRESHPRVPAAGVELYPGRHPAVVTKEQFEAAASFLAGNRSRPGPRQAETANPLAGLVYCARCGRAMVRRPYGGTRPDSLLCPYTSCNTVGSYLAAVEEMILQVLRRWLADCPLDPSHSAAEEDEALLRTLSDAAGAGRKELEALELQKQRACAFLERGVYSAELFALRMSALNRQTAEISARILSLEAEQKDLRRRLDLRQALVPKLTHILDVYPLARTAEEKNRLLKSILQKAVYHKTRRERQKGGSDLTLTLYPRFHR